MLFVLAFVVIGVLLGFALMRLGAPKWAAAALGLSGALVAASSLELDGTLAGCGIFLALVFLLCRRHVSSPPLRET